MDNSKPQGSGNPNPKKPTLMLGADLDRIRAITDKYGVADKIRLLSLVCTDCRLPHVIGYPNQPLPVPAVQSIPIVGTTAVSSLSKGTAPVRAGGVPSSKSRVKVSPSKSKGSKGAAPKPVWTGVAEVIGLKQRIVEIEKRIKAKKAAGKLTKLPPTDSDVVEISEAKIKLRDAKRAYSDAKSDKSQKVAESSQPPESMDQDQGNHPAGEDLDLSIEQQERDIQLAVEKSMEAVKGLSLEQTVEQWKSIDRDAAWFALTNSGKCNKCGFNSDISVNSQTGVIYCRYRKPDGGFAWSTEKDNAGKPRKVATLATDAKWFITTAIRSAFGTSAGAR